MSSQSFPLLNLPCLALLHVVRMFEVKELVPLSLVSSQAKYIVKHYRNKSLGLHLSLMGGLHPTVVLRKQDCYPNVVRIIVKPLSTAQPHELQIVPHDDHEFETYWNNEVRGTEVLLEYLCDLFGIIVKQVTLWRNEVWMLDLVEKMQGSSYVATVLGDEKLSNNKLRHILFKLNPPSLIIASPSSSFRIKNFRRKYDVFHLSSGTWLTMDNLLQLDCIEITITTKKKFTSQEMECYIRHVLTGGAPRLREFCARVEDGAAVFALLEAMPELSTGEEERHVDGPRWVLITKMKREDGMVKISIEYGFCHHMIALTVKEIAE